MERTELTVHGMSCGGCAAAVEAALGRIGGVEAVEVALASGVVTISHDERVSIDALRAGVRDAGFEPV